jgi:hypothetical protein
VQFIKSDKTNKWNVEIIITNKSKKGIIAYITKMRPLSVTVEFLGLSAIGCIEECFNKYK